MVLASYATEDGTNVFPSMSTVAKDLGCCNSQAIRSTQALKKLGYLIKVKDADFANHEATEYRINLDMIQCSHKLSPKVVDNHVDKSVDNLSQIGGATSQVTGGATSSVPPNRSLIQINDHDYDEVKINEQEQALIEQLSTIGFYKKNTIGWLNRLGYDKIVHELELMNKQKNVTNPGGYLQVMLMKRASVIGGNDMARVKKDDYPIPTIGETEVATLRTFRPDAKKTTQVAKKHLSLIKNAIDCVRLNESNVDAVREGST